jgi:hypothetical protein
LTQRELLALNVQHQVSTRNVLHDKVDTSLCLEARVQAKKERVAFTRGREEDSLLRASATQSSYISLFDEGKVFTPTSRLRHGQ